MTIGYSRRGRRTATLSGVALLLLLATAASAHDTAARLEEWGNFGTDTVRCQRTIARAAASCAARALSARNNCLGAQLRGEECDTAEIGRARRSGADARAATGRGDVHREQLQTLRYVDLSDALTDVINVCRDLDTAAITAAYGPAMFGGTIAAVDGQPSRPASTPPRAPPAGCCASPCAPASARSTRSPRRRWSCRRSSRDPRAQRAPHRARQRADQARASSRACPADDFEDVYGRDIDEFLARIAGRADCLGESVYVQNAVELPARQSAATACRSSPHGGVRRRQRLRRRRLPRRLRQDRVRRLPHHLRSHPEGDLREPRLHQRRLPRRRPDRAASICAPASRTPTCSTSTSETVPGYQARRPRQQGNEPAVDQPRGAHAARPVHRAAARHAARPLAPLSTDELEALRHVDRDRRRGARRQPARPPRTCSTPASPSPSRSKIDPLEPPPAGQRRAAAHAGVDAGGRRASPRSASRATTTSPARSRPSSSPPTASASATRASTSARTRSAIT